MPEGTTITPTDEQLAGVKYDSDGLVAAIAQDVENGDVLMLAWMNEESLKMTLAEGRMVYWSRSRQELWLSLIHISEPTRPELVSRMPSSA